MVIHQEEKNNMALFDKDFEDNFSFVKTKIENNNACITGNTYASVWNLASGKQYFNSERYLSDKEIKKLCIENNVDFLSLKDIGFNSEKHSMLIQCSFSNIADKPMFVIKVSNLDNPDSSFVIDKLKVPVKWQNSFKRYLSNNLNNPDKDSFYYKILKIEEIEKKHSIERFERGR